MKQFLTKTRPVDFEEFGYQTRLTCADMQSAIQICGLNLRAYEDELRSELLKVNSEIVANRKRYDALHAQLYDRPIPVSDAAMLTHSLKCSILLALVAVASIACLVGNATTFLLLGFEFPLSVVAAVGITALPLVVGHLAFEKIVARNRGLQILVIAVVAGLCFGALLKFGEARGDMVDRATAPTTTASYVDEPSDGASSEPEPKSNEKSESRIHQTIGQAILWFMLAADIVLGFLVGLLAQLRTNEDYAAWKELKILGEALSALEKKATGLIAAPEIAKKYCMAGILRAQNMLNKRRPPYHPVLTVFVFLILFAVRASWAQNIERYEGILIDTSGSISRGGTTDELFHEYLIATKQLLLTEPPNTRVWVSSISTDSFGGAQEILKGWTPDARGIFTDNLNRARRELVSSFEVKSSGMAPLAHGTDIFGGLWHLKALFDSSPKSDTSRVVPKSIWIFSDMMNETKEFPMLALIEMGSERMAERAKSNGHIVPLNGYKIYVCGAASIGLTPQIWTTVKRFWTAYFSLAGAELELYSAECNVER